MPIAPTYPGVYIEEISSGVRTITGVPTAVTALIGRARRGPVNEPIIINSYGDFERIFGVLWEESTLGFAVRDFFLNGGGQALIIRLFHPRFANDTEYNNALAAAQDVASAAKSEAAKATAKTESVVDAARTKSDTFTAEPQKAAAEIVTKKTEEVAAEAPSGGTVKEAANTRASKPDYANDPRKTAAKLVNDAVATSAAAPDMTPDLIAAEALKAANDVAMAGQSVAEAARDAAALEGADKDSVKNKSRDKANEFNTEPRKKAADLAASAAEAASTLAGATAMSVAVAARRDADAIKAAADDVARAAETAAARIKKVAEAAEAAVPVAAPQANARLQVNGLDLEAANEGAWGNQLRARIDHLVKDNDLKLFNLTVRDAGTGQTEVHRNLSLVAAHPRCIEKVLKNDSKLVFFRTTQLMARPDKHANPPAGVADPFDELAPDSHSKVSKRSSDGAMLDENDFIGDGKSDNKEGLYSLEKADLFNLLCIPPYSPDDDIQKTLWSKAATYCGQRRAMLLVDAPRDWTTKDHARDRLDSDIGLANRNAALFFPRLKQPNPKRNGQVEEFAPCGAVAGVFARIDAQRGVWKAPAGLEATLTGVPELSVALTDPENGELNTIGINCLRSMPAVGRVVWGARTLEGDDRIASEWKYIPVRRVALFIEESLYRGTQWVVFEPNDEPLWSQIRLNIGAFMQNLFRQGAFQGKSPRDAYFVKCDRETTTQTDINLGIVNIVVGFAPLKPAEFVIIKIQQMAGQIQT